jgi:hypothetical protein
MNQETLAQALYKLVVNDERQIPTPWDEAEFQDGWRHKAGRILDEMQVPA